MFEKMNRATPDLMKDNIDKLKQLFPDIVADGKIDFDKLQVILGKEIDEAPDRYNFTWHGKKEAMQFAQQPSKATLRPDKEKSKDWDTTGNLYIEGDNLEVLKLLQKSYNNKVKMIYIDPPYNTGNDFVYKDDFKDSVDSYLELTGQKDGEGNKFTTNTESNGRYHTDWLNMMYSRLKLARNLLVEDGVIFVSIDEVESYNLRKVCNEIFGESNFISNIVWQSRTSISNDHAISLNHNNTYIYAKNIQELKFGGEHLEADQYVNPDNDKRGPWKLSPIDANHVGGNTYYPIVNPKTNVSYYPPNGRIWAYNEQGYQALLEDGRIKFGINDDSAPKRKLYLEERLQKGDKKTPSSLLLNAGTTKDGTKEIMSLFDNKKIFDYPKPTLLIKKLILFSGSEKEDIILDFFSGSATTAHSTMQLNAEDGGNRKFIMVQLPEKLDEKSEAYKDGYRTICDIGEERIRRAGEKVKSDLIEKNNKEGMLSKNQVNPDDLDVGFKVFSLDSSNLTEWQANFDELESNIDLFESNFLNGRSELDILFEIMLKNGLDLTYPVTEISEGNHKIYDVAAGNLFVCLNENINRDVARKIATLRKEYGIETSQVVFKDSGFEDDTEKLNCYEILKEVSYQDSDLLSI